MLSELLVLHLPIYTLVLSLLMAILVLVNLLCSFVLVLLPLSVGTYYALTHEITLYSVIASFISGMFSVAILLANNIRDIETDRESNKKLFLLVSDTKLRLLLFKIAILLIFLSIVGIGVSNIIGHLPHLLFPLLLVY